MANEAPERQIKHQNDQRRDDIEQQWDENVTVQNVDDEWCRIACVSAII